MMLSARNVFKDTETSREIGDGQRYSRPCDLNGVFKTLIMGISKQ